MSAAIAHKNTANTTATNTTTHMYFECGDIFTTNKSRTPNGHSINVLAINNNNNNNNNTNSPLNSYDNVMDISSSNHSSIEHMDKINHIPLQQQKPQSLIIGQEKNQHIAVYRGHAALTRTISTPQPQYKQGQQQQYINGQGEQQQQQQSIQQSQQLQQQQQQQQQTAQDGNVATLVNTLIENLGNLNLHRKLERTQSEPLPQPVNTSRYKTELCRPFEEAGECKYGEKCQFAHGYHELRNLQRHPKYKTEFCRTFHSVGFCPYGPRCHFVHNADEARALQQQQQQQQQQFQQQQQTKLQNHSNAFLVVAPAAFHHVSTKSTKNNTQLAVGGGGTTINNNHALPLSPPLSMSTGSDRESPTGSLSLSPTSSMTNFSFGEQVNNTNNTVFQAAFQYMNTPPDSPGAAMSPVNTPPPPPPPTTLILNGQTPIYIKANNMNNNNNIKVINQQQLAVVTPPIKQLLQKSSSSPIAILRHNVVNKVATPNKVQSVSSLNIMNLAVPTMDEQRLPVFNRLSLAVDNNIINNNNNNNNNSNDTANNTNIISSYTQVAL